jgi:DNA-binding NarL/FixJ family response regulator
VHQLSLVSAHLVAARRLRELEDARSDPVAAAEAILDPSGAVYEARGGARAREERDLLAEAVRRVERARGAARRVAPDEALSLWHGLVNGEWTLVDHVDTDRRRFVLARRNPPGVRDPKALTPRERDVLGYVALGHSNKFVGYMLGLAPSTVAGHLESAARKLGVSSRLELIRAFGGGRRQPEDDES